MENVIIKFTADTTGLQPAVDQLKLLGKITEDDAKKIDEINQSQARYLNTLKSTTKEAGNFANEMAHLKNEIQAGILEGIAEHMKEFGKETENTGKKAKTLKQELKELKAQIASGGLDAKELSKATQRAAELTDHLGDVQQKIKALSSDTKRIDAVVEAFRGLAAGVAITQGAIGLLGGENKELEKTLLKVQSAMALLQGVQEVANLVTGEGILKTTLLSVSQKLAGKSATIMGIEITAATAMATAGVSLLVAGLAYLIVEMNTTEESAEEMSEKMSKIYEKDKEVYERVLGKRLELLKESKKGELDALQIAYNYEFNKREQERRKTAQSQESFDAETIINFEIYNKQKAEIEKSWSDKEVKAVQEREARKKKAIDDAQKAELQSIKELQAEQQLIIKDTSGDTRVDAFKKLTELKKKEIDLDKSLGDKQKELQKSILDDELLTYAFKEHSRLSINKETNDLEFTQHEELNEKKLDSDKKYLEDKAKAEEETMKRLQLLAVDVAAQTSDFLFNDYKTRLQNETDLDITTQEEQTQLLLQNEELSQAQSQAIERMGQREIARIKQEAFRKQKNADIIQAGINTALGITRSFATDPTGITAIAIGVAGGLQIAAIERQPIPKFAKGTKGVEGGGTSTSDSILAYLSKGEMVIPTSTKESYFPALETIFDKKVSPSIANELLAEAAKGNYNISADYGSSVFVTNNTTIDYDRLDKLFSKNKSVTQINMDEVGFRKFVITENVKTEYLNKRFRK